MSRSFFRPNFYISFWSRPRRLAALCSRSHRRAAGPRVRSSIHTRRVRECDCECARDACPPAPFETAQILSSRWRKADDWRVLPPRQRRYPNKGACQRMAAAPLLNQHKPQLNLSIGKKTEEARRWSSRQRQGKNLRASSQGLPWPRLQSPSHPWLRGWPSWPATGNPAAR
ncbi:hypothetical protein BC830DRAFT_14550 [Chytriomyces sp. MP71]|nr:hypothetical protein BC830DRAFT_14550 [Chytriomyces sp. MP71]